MRPTTNAALRTREANAAYRQQSKTDIMCQTWCKLQSTEGKQVCFRCGGNHVAYKCSCSPAAERSWRETCIAAVVGAKLGGPDFVPDTIPAAGSVWPSQSAQSAGGAAEQGAAEDKAEAADRDRLAAIIAEQHNLKAEIKAISERTRNRG